MHNTHLHQYTQTLPLSGLLPPHYRVRHKKIIYETAKRPGEAEEEEENEGASYIPEPEVTEFSTKHFVSVASPYVSSYAYRSWNVDKDFGIRREADGSFRIGNSVVDIYPQRNVYVQGKIYEGSRGLFELLTRKKVNLMI